MTTITKTPVVFLAAVATTALSSTKAAPNVSTGWIDLGAPTSYDGGDMGLSVVNGTAPTAAGNILIQWSPDNGTTIYDYGYPLTGDLVAGSVTTASVWIDPGLRYVRVIGYGNAGNNVTFGATFSGVTRA